MPSHSFKAIFFDVGNTLLLPFPSVVDICTEVLALRGYTVDPGRLSQALALADQAYEDQYRRDDSFWMKEMDTAKFWIELYELMLNDAGLQEETTELASDIYTAFGQADRWQPYPDVLPTLTRLSEAGFKIGLVSNWDTRLTSLSVETGLSKYLDFVISSANVGLLKPQPQIFELALERAGVGAAETMHVGDHYYADIMGARSVGITPVLLDRKGTVSNADCLVINSLHELVSYLWSH
ncbi:MAG: HAD-IA family hydrolase [Actinomycetota bacterium]|nr:HAD-IA family hydrolase [Actinomycetota bacterium]